MGGLGTGGPEGVRRTYRHAPHGDPRRHCACCAVPGFGLCFLDHRADPSRHGIAELAEAWPRKVDAGFRTRPCARKSGETYDRTKAAGTLAVAGGTLARAGQPGARRPPAAAEELEKRRPLRLRDLVRFRS